MNQLTPFADFRSLQSGQNRNLVIILSKYEPNVACYGPPSDFRGAGQDLLALIPVTTDQVAFGPEGEPGVEVVVPKTFDKARAYGK